MCWAAGPARAPRYAERRGGTLLPRCQARQDTDGQTPHAPWRALRRDGARATLIRAIVRCEAVTVQRNGVR